MKTHHFFHRVAILAMWMLLAPIVIFAQEPLKFQKYVQLAPDISNMPRRYIIPVDPVYIQPRPTDVSMYNRPSQPTLGFSGGGGLSFANSKWNIEVGLQVALRGYAFNAKYPENIATTEDTLLSSYSYSGGILATLPVMVDRYFPVGKAKIYLGAGVSIGARVRDVVYSTVVFKGREAQSSFYFNRASTPIVGSLLARAGVEWEMASGKKVRLGPHGAFQRGIPFKAGYKGNNWWAVGLQLGYYWGK